MSFIIKHDRERMPPTFLGNECPHKLIGNKCLPILRKNDWPQSFPETNAPLPSRGTNALQIYREGMPRERMPRVGMPREGMPQVLGWERISGNECPENEGSRNECPSASRIDPYN